MGNYTVIADVGQAMIKLLRSQMVPEVIPKEEQIGFCTPQEVGNYRLGIYLYDIRESDVGRNEPKRWQGETVQVYPSMYLELYYMLFPLSQSNLQYRAVEEQKILGKLLQSLRDFPVMNAKTYEIEEKISSGTLQIEILDLSYEEKTKIWNNIHDTMRNVVYCKISPVELQSERRQQIHRVREVQLQFGEGGVENHVG